MRLMTWNCRDGLSRKQSIVETIRPDIAIIQECSKADALNLAGTGDIVWKTKSSGTNENKGMAVICFNPAFSLQTPPLPDQWNEMMKTDPSRLDLLIPVEIKGTRNFNLLATWSFNNRDRADKRKLEGPILMAARFQKTWLAKSNSIIAGDFNHSPVFDRYTDVNFFHKHIDAFKEVNLTSLYHHSSGEAFGEETCPSHLWRGKSPFTIDYIFADLTSWRLDSCKKMSFSGLEKFGIKSDHTPIWADLSG